MHVDVGLVGREDSRDTRSAATAYRRVCLRDSTRGGAKNPEKIRNFVVLGGLPSIDVYEHPRIHKAIFEYVSGLWLLLYICAPRPRASLRTQIKFRRESSFGLGCVMLCVAAGGWDNCKGSTFGALTRVDKD